MKHKIQETFLKCLRSLTIREIQIQIKAIMRFHVSPIRMTNAEKKAKMTNADRYVEN